MSYNIKFSSYKERLLGMTEMYIEECIETKKKLEEAFDRFWRNRYNTLLVDFIEKAVVEKDLKYIYQISLLTKYILKNMDNNQCKIINKLLDFAINTSLFAKSHAVARHLGRYLPTHVKKELFYKMQNSAGSKKDKLLMILIYCKDKQIYNEIKKLENTESDFVDSCVAYMSCNNSGINTYSVNNILRILNYFIENWDESNKIIKKYKSYYIINDLLILIKDHSLVYYKKMVENLIEIVNKNVSENIIKIKYYVCKQSYENNLLIEDKTKEIEEKNLDSLRDDSRFILAIIDKIEFKIRYLLDINNELKAKIINGFSYPEAVRNVTMWEYVLCNSGCNFDTTWVKYDANKKIGEIYSKLRYIFDKTLNETLIQEKRALDVVSEGMDAELPYIFSHGPYIGHPRYIIKYRFGDGAVNSFISLNIVV